MEPCAALNLSICGGAYVRRAEATGRLHAESRKVVEAQTPTEAIFANGSLAPSAQKLTIRISGKDVENKKKDDRREDRINPDQPREKNRSIREDSDRTGTLRGDPDRAEPPQTGRSDRKKGERVCTKRGMQNMHLHQRLMGCMGKTGKVEMGKPVVSLAPCRYASSWRASLRSSGSFRPPAGNSVWRFPFSFLRADKRCMCRWKKNGNMSFRSF